jgi:DNA polymerase
MNLIEKLRSQQWTSVLLEGSVPGVPGDKVAHIEPVEEEYMGHNMHLFTREKPEVYKGNTYSGLYSASCGAGTPGTTPIQLPDLASPPAQGPWSLPRLVVDIESYYDANFSLGKLSTSDYVFDSRFAIHGIAVAYPDGRAEFRTDVEVLISELRMAYGENLEQVLVVFHNGYFDYFALFHQVGFRAAQMADTMLLSYLVNGPDTPASLKDLATRYGLPAKGDLEFMKGVRAPDTNQLDRLREYAVNDVLITSSLAEILLPQAASQSLEMWMMAHSIRQFVERPLPIDRGVVEAATTALEADLDRLVTATGFSETDLRSQKFDGIFTAALISARRKIPVKQGKRGLRLAIAKSDPARDQLLADPDPMVRGLMEAKVALGSASGLRSRFRRLQGMSNATGTCHVLLKYYGAVTGRFAGGDKFNVQNLKKPDPGVANASAAGSVRKALTAGSDIFVSADASQVEARILAYLAGQDDLLQDFADKVDVYSVFAAERFHREVRKPLETDPPDVAAELNRYRQIGKQIILGLGFGMGAARFYGGLRSKSDLRPLFDQGVLTEAVCAEVVHVYRKQYSRIPEFWRACDEAAWLAFHGQATEVQGIGFACQNGALYIRLRSGRRLVYPLIRETPPSFMERQYMDADGLTQSYLDENPRLIYGLGYGLYGGKIVENIVQATARDLLVEVIHRLEQEGFPVAIHVHDSVAVRVAPERQQAARDALQCAWKSVPAWAPGLVLDAEVKTGKTLNDV